MEHVVDMVGKINGVWLFLMVGAIGWAISEMVKSVAKQHRLARQTEQMAVLKKSMIDRGMSADEIERVIRAGEEPPADPRFPKEPKGPIAAMVKQGMDAKEIEKVIGSGLQTSEGPDEVVRTMSKHGYSGDDIARVIGALDRRPRVPTV